MDLHLSVEISQRRGSALAIELAKTKDELKQMPLVELAWEILKAKKEPFYFRDLMNEIQVLRGMSEAEVMDVIARLYTEINIDGRFVCIGQNVWGLKRWYPVDKGTEKGLSGKRFVRRSGDAFSDDDEDLDEDFEDIVVEDEVDDLVLFGTADDEEASDDDAEEDLVIEDEDNLFSEDEEESIEEEPLLDEEEDSDDEDEED